MAMKESLKYSAAMTFKENVLLIDVDDLHDSPDNFFEVDRISEFAETIYEQGGVQQTLVVSERDGGGYEIISGHRRVAAIRELLKNDVFVARHLPCVVQRYSDEDKKKLDIVLYNVSSRIISDTELWKSYEVVNEILQKRKETGERFGKIRTKIAEILGISETQTARLQSIDKNAIPEVREAVKSGDVSIRAASEVSRLDSEKQEKLIDTTPFSQITPTVANQSLRKKDVPWDTTKEPLSANTEKSDYIKNTSVSGVISDKRMKNTVTEKEKPVSTASSAISTFSPNLLSSDATEEEILQAYGEALKRAAREKNWSYHFPPEIDTYFRTHKPIVKYIVDVVLAESEDPDVLECREYIIKALKEIEQADVDKVLFRLG